MSQPFLSGMSQWNIFCRHTGALLRVDAPSGLFDGGDFADPADVAFFAGEFGVEKGPDDHFGDFGADDPGAEAEDIGVVVLDTLGGGIHIVAEGGTNPGHFIRGHTGADAAAAQEDAAVRLLLQHGVTDRFREIGVIHRIGGVGAQVQDFVTAFFDDLSYFRFQRESRMITSQRDFHVPCPSI